MYYVYMIRCVGDSYYTGMTNNVCRRMKAHDQGKGCKYTAAHRPTELMMLWRCGSETAARRLEFAIKKRLSRAEKEALIDEPDAVWDWLPQLEGEEYVAISNVTLEDCLEDRFHD